jgi:Na+-translocating ferredoxin:NAD+ oxidoreductase subunit B
MGTGTAARPEMLPRRALIDTAVCTACGECVRECPKGAIRQPSEFCCAKCVKYCLAMEVPCSPVGVSVCPDLCDGCGLCVPVCPVEAVSMVEAVIAL